jgi:starch synthase
MRVLFVTSEVAGVFKKGGLGDVSYALPVALTRLGVEVAIALPYYALIKSDTVHCVGQMAVDFDGKRELVFVFKIMLPGHKVPVYMFRHPLLNEYQGDDMAATFAFFSACVVRLDLYAPEVMGGQFDVIHCHDWHTALVPLMLGEGDKTSNNDNESRKWMMGKKTRGNNRLESKAVKTVLTIHNLLYGGETGTKLIDKIGLPASLFHPYETPLGHAIKLLREGLDYVDIISTVSPTYAREISTRGKGRVGSVLHLRKDKVIGILNGIDTTIWDPKTDCALTSHYDILSVNQGKPKVKDALLASLKMPLLGVPLFGFVGRIEPRQKGTDLIRQAVPKLIKNSFQLIILGTGNPKEEKLLTQLSEKYPNVNFVNTFDERLARRIYAGCDAMLVPSLFEPCGLTQMIAMRYGTIPLVRKTGGLADSVIDRKTGFVFEKYTSGALLAKMNELIAIWKNDKNIWAKMVLNAMREDFSWRASAKKYLEMYEGLISNKSNKS